mmetsp:Transcript_9284/g.28100  ORF Transcript_9284/g.28100 Transcript_9284/m.28100 type:complete len:219 (-) Transcript_9284:265-921(-)
MLAMPSARGKTLPQMCLPASCASGRARAAIAPITAMRLPRRRRHLSPSTSPPSPLRSCPASKSLSCYVSLPSACGLRIGTTVNTQRGMGSRPPASHSTLVTSRPTGVSVSASTARMRAHYASRGTGRHRRMSTTIATNSSKACTQSLSANGRHGSGRGSFWCWRPASILPDRCARRAEFGNGSGCAHPRKGNSCQRGGSNPTTRCCGLSRDTASHKAM